MVGRPGKNFSIILTNHGHFGLFSTSLKFERGRPRWILSDSRSTWKIQIVSKRMQNTSNVSMWGGAGRSTVKLHQAAKCYVRHLVLWGRVVVWNRVISLSRQSLYGAVAIYDPLPRKHSGAWRALLWVTEGNALGLELNEKHLPEISCKWAQSQAGLSYAECSRDSTFSLSQMSRAKFT